MKSRSIIVNKIKPVFNNTRPKSLWKKNRLLKIMWSIFRAVLLISLSFILLYPLIYMFSVAFRPAEQLTDPTVVWIPKSLTLDNMKAAMEALDFKASFFNSIKLNIGAAFLQIFPCALAGYGFSRFKFKGRKILFALVILTIIVPAQTTAIPMYMEYRYFDLFGIGSLIGLITGTPLQVNLRNTIWTFYLPAIFANGLRSGLFIYMFRQFFIGLPKDLEDAAYIDGAGTFKTFMRVVVPTSGSVFLTVFLFSTVWYWNDVLNVSMYFDRLKTISYALKGLPTALNQLFSADNGDIYLMAARLEAGCVLTILPLLIVFIVLQRYFTESIQNTGIKG